MAGFTSDQWAKFVADVSKYQNAHHVRLMRASHFMLGVIVGVLLAVLLSALILGLLLLSVNVDSPASSSTEQSYSSFESLRFDGRRALQLRWPPRVLTMRATE